MRKCINIQTTRVMKEKTFYMTTKRPDTAPKRLPEHQAVNSLRLTDFSIFLNDNGIAENLTIKMVKLPGLTASMKSVPLYSAFTMTT